MRLSFGSLGIALLAAACVAPAGAQGPLREVESRRDGLLSFSYASRADVCATGGITLRFGSGPFDYQSFTWSSSSGWGGPCERGTVRVLLTRAEGVTTGARIGVGSGPLPEGTTDLGAVSAATAGAYLLDLAARTDGRAARDLLLAGVIADSAETSGGLLRIARDRAQVTSLRESAIGWLGREAALAAPGARRGMVAALLALARDEDEPLAVRRRATTALGRAGSEGVEAALTLADARDLPLARAAIEALGSSGDPRARGFLRRAARDADRPATVRAQIIKALAGRDAAPSDYALLRELYPSLTASSERTAVIDAIAQAGGSVNLRWLLGLVADGEGAAADHRRAARGAVQAGATSADLIRLYDGAASRPLKETLVEQLIRVGDRAAIDKVTRIAASDTDPAVRRSAIRRLAQSGDGEAVEALKALIEP